MAFLLPTGYAYVRWARFVELRLRQRAKLAAVLEMVGRRDTCAALQRCWSAWRAAVARGRHVEARATAMAAQCGARLLQVG